MPDLLPCATCPWRVNKDATTIPSYSHSKACDLLNTVGPSDDFRQIMACHHAVVGREVERPCMGYLAMEGMSNINVRLLACIGKLPWPSRVLEACEAAGVDMHSDYASVLNKLQRGGSCA
jgi:Family of unknown function (DUF6283)